MVVVVAVVDIISAIAIDAANVFAVVVAVIVASLVIVVVVVVVTIVVVVAAGVAVLVAVVPGSTLNPRFMEQRGNS